MDESAAAEEVARLRADFPRYTIGIVTTLDRRRYIAQRRAPGPGPYAVLTDDLGELRDALSEGHRTSGS
jgi:hypothetical protein